MGLKDAFSAHVCVLLVFAHRSHIVSFQEDFIHRPIASKLI